MFTSVLTKINKKVIPIKLFGFLWHVAIHMVFPFLTLQMTQIGLNLEDVSIVYGLTPLVTFLSAPLTGKFTKILWMCSKNFRRKKS